MHKHQLQSEMDFNLKAELMGEQSIEKAIKLIKAYEEKNPSSDTRKSLLSSSIRLSEMVSPAIHKISKKCIEKLKIDLPVELFVYSSPQFNAACYKPEGGKLYIIFSSSLIESFNEEEIKYVLGHELGHYMFGHHDIPIGYITHGENPMNIDRALFLKLFKWSRYAEISADRAGAYCVDDFSSVASSLFKLSSGITKFDLVKFKINDYLKQIDELLKHETDKKRDNYQDWFSTHPLSPLRVKALSYFFESKVFKKEGSSTDKLEEQVEETLSFMDPDYMNSQTEKSKALRDLFIAASAILASVDGEISKSELEAINKVTGGSVNIEAISIDRISDDLPKRIDKVNELNSDFQKQQVLRDLSLLISPIENAKPEEHDFLNELMTKLNVDTSLLETLANPRPYLD